MSVYVKAPAAVLDYGFDWGPWLDSAGNDTIETSTWEVDTGITHDNDDDDGRVTSIWFSAGTLGEDYAAHNTIHTVGGRTDTRTVIIKVRHR